MSELNYKKTVIRVEIISEGDWSWDNLHEVADAIKNGGCSGNVEEVSVESLTPGEAAAALEAQGSEPAFLLGNQWQAPRTTDAIIGTYYKMAGKEGESLRSVGSITFNATQSILTMPLSWIKNIEDGEHSSEIIGNMFVRHDGPCRVEITDSICGFFDIESLDELTDELLKNARDVFGL